MKEKRSVEKLIADLQSEDDRVRERAVEAFRELGELGAVEALRNLGELAVELLLQALQDEESKVRRDKWYAVEAFRDLGELAVEPLIQALQEEESEVRGRAAEALGKLGELGNGDVDTSTTR